MTRQPKSMVPKVRFKGFTDEWEQRKFSEILAKSDGLRRGPFGSALKKEFFISSSEYTVYEQNNAIYNTWKTRYFITPEKFQELHKFQLMPGDFILSGAGTIGRIAQVPANITKGVFNQALIRIRINPEWMDKKFFLIWMQSENMQRKLTQANPGSAMTNLVPMSEIKKWEIIIPSKAEQNKIGEFIQKLNSLIALQQRKLDQLNTLKKGLLQKMFADKKHPQPELRFKSFHDNWINHKAGDFMIERNQKATIDDDFPLKAFIANKGVADKGERYDRSAITNDASNKMYKRTLFNDFIYSSNNLETGSIGLNKYGNASISPVYSIFYFKNKESADFFGRILVRKEFINSMIRYRQGVVYGQWRIKEKDFLNISISVPSLEEQEKIGSLLDKLDETINVNSKLLNQLKVLKKSLLQNMFI